MPPRTASRSNLSNVSIDALVHRAQPVTLVIPWMWCIRRKRGMTLSFRNSHTLMRHDICKAMFAWVVTTPSDLLLVQLVYRIIAGPAGGARSSTSISCRPRRGAEGRFNPYSLHHLRRRPRRQMQWRLLGEYSHSGLRHRLADWDGNPHRRTISPSEQRHATRWFGQEGQEGQRLVPRLCCRCGEECPSRRSRVIARDDNRSSRPR